MPSQGVRLVSFIVDKRPGRKGSEAVPNPKIPLFSG